MFLINLSLIDTIIQSLFSAISAIKEGEECHFTGRTKEQINNVLSKRKNYTLDEMTAEEKVIVLAFNELVNQALELLEKNGDIVDYVIPHYARRIATHFEHNMYGIFDYVDVIEFESYYNNFYFKISKKDALDEAIERLASEIKDKARILTSNEEPGFELFEEYDVANIDYVDVAIERDEDPYEPWCGDTIYIRDPKNHNCIMVFYTNDIRLYKGGYKLKNFKTVQQFVDFLQQFDVKYKGRRYL